MKASLLSDVKTTLMGELEKLRDQVRQLAEGLTDEQLWARPLEPGNSLGHLILHLTGNLSHFVGAHLGNTGYVREREREFTQTQHPPRAELLAGLDAAVATFRKVVTGLTEKQLLGPHPEPRFGSVLQALVHLLNHFALHRGQMSYLVRLLPQKK